MRFSIVVVALIGLAVATNGTSTSSARLNLEKIKLQARPAQGSSVGGPQNTANAAAEGPERYSGYFKLKRAFDAHMFFFLFEAREDPDNAPVVLWMTGGPGCSSELAVFYENGPWHITKDLELEETEFGWDRAAHMIFVDQPINTGFSYSEDDRDRCYDEACVSDDMLDFLQALLEARPNLAGRDFFVTGESYAGHYVPAVAARIFQASKSGEMSKPIQLAGLAIGNGLTDPAIQYGYYADFALEHDLISESMRENIMQFYPACRLALQACDGFGIAAECLLAVNFCQITMFAPIMVENPLINVYDIRKKCEGPLCYDFSLMEEYLNLPEVRKQLGVGDRPWVACDPGVHEDMMSDWGHSFDNVLPEMMAAGVRVMIYAGDQDLICNVLGNRMWVNALEWERSDEWATAANMTWSIDGENAGIVTEVGPLSFVSVNDAGHMVPMDKPKQALDMIMKFTRGESLAPSVSPDVRSGAPSAGVKGVLPKGGDAAGVGMFAGRKGGPGVQVV